MKKVKPLTISLAFAMLLFLLGVAAGQTVPDVLWTYSGVGASSPAIAADGTVYIGGSSGLLAITNSGSTASNKWTFPVTVYPSSSPAVGADGTIYFVDYNGSLNALNPDGSSKWLYAGGGGGGTPAIGLDNTIYYQAYTGLFAITPSGSRKWKGAVGAIGYFSSPVVGMDGTVYIGSFASQKLYAVNPDGTNKWVQDLLGNGDSPVIGSDGTIYITAGYLYAFSADGTNLWTSSADSLKGPLVMGEDGTIYVLADISHALYAISPGGQTVTNLFGGQGSLSPGWAAAVDAAGIIYYCGANGIWALNRTGTVQWSITNSSPPLQTYTSPIIGPDGTHYATLDRTLYAIATGTTGPAKSPWPMYHQNARNTGKVEKPALKQPKKRADANFEFQLYAQLGQTNVIEATTNLNIWTSLTNLVVTNVPMDVIDFTASNFPARLYRTRTP